jgi:hypothetical protein
MPLLGSSQFTLTMPRVPFQLPGQSVDCCRRIIMRADPGDMKKPVTFVHNR